MDVFFLVVRHPPKAGVFFCGVCLRSWLFGVGKWIGVICEIYMLVSTKSI